jgi:hypothetical protein
VLSPSLFDSLSLYLLSHIQDALAISEVNIGRRLIVEAFVITPAILVLDEVGNRTFEIAGQVVVSE